MSRKRAADRPLVSPHMDAKHESLMQDFLQLQDEFVAFKDRLQAAKMKKATLLAEVRFLRRRLKKLKETPNLKASVIRQYVSSTACSGKTASQAVAAGSSCLSPRTNLLGPKGIQVFWEPLRTIGCDESAKQQAVNDNVELVSALKTSVLQNRMNVLDTVMGGKRKISWQDQISLECN